MLSGVLVSTDELASVPKSLIYSMRVQGWVEYQELLHGNGPIRLLDSVYKCIIILLMQLDQF